MLEILGFLIIIGLVVILFVGVIQFVGRLLVLAAVGVLMLVLLSFVLDEQPDILSNTVDFTQEQIESVGNYLEDSLDI